MKQSILLVVTNRCNLNCVYCYETNKNHFDMSSEMAKDIIQKELLSNDLKSIEFHGGEPLLNFNLVKDVCEWVWTCFPDKNVDFFLTTNGTQFSSEYKKWFEINHKRIVCALSLDGTPQMNLDNRGCVINEDTLSFVHKLWPNQTVKMTISLKTLLSLAEGVIYAHKKGFKVSANLAYGIDWNKSDINIYKRELQKLVDFYLEHPEIEPCSIFDGEKLVKILKPYSLTRHCQAGQSFHAYDIDGKKYPCHVFCGNTLKTEKWHEISYSDFKNDALFDDPMCTECAIHNICPTCYGMNFIERGTVYSRDKSMCDYIKAEKIAACKLHKQRILSKEFDSITDREYLILKSIKELSDRLQIEI